MVQNRVNMAGTVQEIAAHTPVTARMERLVSTVKQVGHQYTSVSIGYAYEKCFFFEENGVAKHIFTNLQSQYIPANNATIQIFTSFDSRDC